MSVSGSAILIRLRIEQVESELRITADFPQQGRGGFVFTEASRVGDVLSFTSRSLGRYRGVVDAGGQRIDGEFVDGDQRRALILHAGDAPISAPMRPQTPRAPFGYAIEAVSVEAPGGVRLAGTLTRPHRGLRATALLINGSGALDRDETVFGHKPFWVLADHLSRHGYAVLRLDDRGVGESGGHRHGITLADEADDLSAALDYLHTHAALRAAPIGLIGHSMGGALGQWLTARRDDVAFLVSLAGPGLRLGEVLAVREGETLARMGTDAAAVARHVAFARALFRELAERAVDAPIDGEHVLQIALAHGADATAQANAADWIARYNEAWFRSALRYDPARCLGDIRAPVLALNGARDVQVPARANLDAIAQALAHHADFETDELDGLNHLFQTCTTGEAYEYPIIEETFAPLALERIRAWLDRRFAPRGE
ncbi:MAG: alpha/beta fold hydrolase [Lysobacter sp.]|nr:alpha/beta fold hydrolase [Lysobacter sp.]